MRELLLILTLLTAFTFLSCSKDKVKNEEVNKSDSETSIKNEDVKLKKSDINISITNYEYVYEKKSDGEVLVSKTGYSAEGKKVITIDFVEDPGFSITTYEYNDKNQLIKSTTLFSDPQSPESKDTLKYTVTYIYDKEGKELGFRLDGDYAFEPAPNVFEYVYEKGNKPTKRFDYMEDEEGKTLFFTVYFKYDKKGNKVEEKRVANNFDYKETKTYEYDENNRIIKETIVTNGDKRVFVYKYDK